MGKECVECLTADSEMIRPSADKLFCCLVVAGREERHSQRPQRPIVASVRAIVILLAIARLLSVVVHLKVSLFSPGQLLNWQSDTRTATTDNSCVSIATSWSACHTRCGGVMG